MRLASYFSNTIIFRNLRHTNIKMNFGICCSGKSDFGFNILFLKRLWRLLAIIFKKFLNIPGFMLSLLFLCSCFDEFLGYHTGMISSKFMTALVNKSSGGFFKELIIAIILVSIKSFSTSLVTYIGNVLYLACRHALTNHLHRVYFSSKAYYDVNLFNKDVDNPDQRITQDVDKMSRSISNVIVAIILTPITIGYYSKKVYDVGGWISLLWVFSFFIAFYILNKFLMSCVARWVAKREAQEGHFRFQHVNVRTNAESVAFLGGGYSEFIKSNRGFKKLASTLQGMFNVELPLNASVEFSSYFSALLSYIIVSTQILSPKFDNMTAGAISGFISATGFVTIYLVSKLTVFVRVSVDLSILAGTSHRIGQLLEVIDEIHGVKTTDQLEDRPRGYSMKEKQSKDDNWFCQLNQLTIFPAGERKSNTVPLIKNLDLEVVAGQNILVTGPSGIGKTSLLRVIKGLWSSYSGSIVRSSDFEADIANVLFLPQKPIITEGSFEDQIIYPSLRNEEYDQEFSSDFKNSNQFKKWLNLVDLEDLFNLCGGYDVPVSFCWNEMLSPGEMQRMNFLRLFYRRPKYAFLDEATSAISTSMEAKLYQECQNLEITLISISHRESLGRFHQINLDIQEDGNWTIQKI